MHQVKGRIKEITEEVSMNPDLEAEGKDENLDRKVQEQEKIDQIEKAIGK